MKPLENWEYSPPTLIELALKIKRDMDAYERGLWHFALKTDTKTQVPHPRPQDCKG